VACFVFGWLGEAKENQANPASVPTEMSCGMRPIRAAAGNVTVWLKPRPAAQNPSHLPAMTKDIARNHQLHGLQPVLTVANVEIAATFFVDVLGFELDEIGLEPTGELRVHVGHDVDRLCAIYKQRGAVVVQEPEDQPWDLRDFLVLEPNGHYIRVCAEVQLASAA